MSRVNVQHSYVGWLCTFGEPKFLHHRACLADGIHLSDSAWLVRYHYRVDHCNFSP